MNPLESLSQYLDRLERRLRLFAWTRGAAAVVGAALALTLLIVGTMRFGAFTPTGLLVGRFALFLGIGAAVAVALVVPLMRLNRRRTAREGEERHPGFDQRLLTFTERARDNASDPFLPLLAEDAMEIARNAQPERLIEKGRFIRFASAGAAAAGVLAWLIFWGPGVLGYGTSLLWGKYSKGSKELPFYSVSVQPGSKTVRKRSDVLVGAHLNGYTASKANIYVQYASAAGKWEEAPMQAQEGGSGFGFMLVGVPEDVQYYVEAGGIKSDVFKLHTIELPSVKNIRVTYAYPSWTGVAPMTEDPGGDLRAVEGTVAKLEITTDKPLSNGRLIFEQGNPITLDQVQGTKITASVPIAKDGSYHIAVLDHGELVRLTDDYFIEARKANAPTVHVTKPGRDAKVSPIEEVPVAATAEDEFPLQELNLHYSVNGQPEKVISLLKNKGAKNAEGASQLSMEDFKAVPGDIVSLYATARDGRSETKTDMFFVEAVPFEFEYSQSQQSGGGGGGGGMGDQEQQISAREKEIIAATFNQVKGDAKSKTENADTGKYLSEVQSKLRDQAQSLANRMKARELDSNGAAFQNFVKEMEAAVQVMTPATDKLKSLAFTDALTPEQQALQHLLRAESQFRQIQVQIGRGGGGGGGGGGAGRDLANLFDLELDKDKNQYETNSSSAAEQKQQQIDDALKKLEELARRQQELANQPQNQQQLAQQRWQQEMLRREAEELKKQMEQLQRGDQGQQGQQQQQQSQNGQSGQSGQSSSQSGSQSGQSGSQSGQQQSASNRSGQQQQQQQQQQQNSNRPPIGQGNRQQQAYNSEQLERAIKDLDQATRDMSTSASARQNGQQGAQGQNDAEQAAERLKQAGQTLESMRHQQNGSELGNLANEADRLADQQNAFENKLKKNFSQGQSNDAVARQMIGEKQKMLDEYNQLQKDMQQTARDLSSTQPGVSKKLRDSMGKSQQEEIGTKMEWTQSALEQGMGQYAIMHEAPVTRTLNELRDDLKRLQNDAAQSAKNDDSSQVATQQALNQAERVRREIEQLGRAGDQRNQGGDRNGNQPGQGQQGQQASNGSQNGQNGQSGQQSGQQGQGRGQQSQGSQQGQQGQGGQQSASNSSPNGSPSPNGGGGGVNNGPRNPNGGGAWNGGNWNNPGGLGAGAWDGSRWDGREDWQNLAATNPQAAYNDLLRDIGRLRAEAGDDKDLAREIADLQRRAQQLDPMHRNNQGQLDSVIGQQVLAGVDQVELVLRKKLAAGDGSVRAATPSSIPPGYANAVAEYNKRLSQH